MSAIPAAATRTCRILFYGPSGCGKTANLRAISGSLPPAHLVAPPGPDTGERLGFHLDAGALGAWVVLLYALDSSSETDEALAGDGGFPYDGVVFVADARASCLDANLSSLESLKNLLAGSGQDLTSLPLVLQYNKRDLPDALPVEQLESLLNPWGVPSNAADASRADGVRDTLRSVLSLTLRQLSQPDQVPSQPSPPQEDPACAPAPPPLPAERPDSIMAAPGPAIHIEPEPATGVMFAQRRPPVVIPVRIPRSTLDKYGSIRLLLEIEVDPRGPGLD